MTFDSVYQMFDPLTTVRKQHFWDWFSGDDLRSTWNKNDISGTNVFAMEDAVDGGFRLETAGGSGNVAAITFNDKRHYSQNSSVVISVMKANQTTDSVVKSGFGNDAAFSDAGGNDSMLQATMHSSLANFRLRHGNTSGVAWTDSSIAKDTSWHSYKIEAKSASAEFTIDGTLEGTATTTLPDEDFQPIFWITASAASVKKGFIRFIEAYNT